jgi:plasmid maintenance system antidote protein VapI
MCLEFWLNLQQMHDLTNAKLALGKTIEAEVRIYQPTAA